MEVKRMELASGICLTAVQTMKFKSSVLSVHLLTPLDHKTAAVQALIPYVTMLQVWPNASFAAGETMLGNIFKTCDDPKWEHIGSFFPADFTLEQPFVPGNFGEFLLVNY